MTSKVLSMLVPVFCVVPIATALGQPYDAPWGDAGMIEGTSNLLSTTACGVHQTCPSTCGWCHESCGQIAHEFVGDLKQLFHPFMHCHSCRSLCCSASAPCANGSDSAPSDYPAMDGVSDDPVGSGGIEIVPRPWPPGYQEVPAPRTDPLSIMKRQRDAYARRASRQPEAKAWIAADAPLTSEVDTLHEPRRIMAMATDDSP
jgi:hypothetical protein